MFDYVWYLVDIMRRVFEKVMDGEGIVRECRLYCFLLFWYKGKVLVYWKFILCF